MGCFKHCRKWTVLTFNLVFLIMGVVLIVVGGISLHNLNDLSKAIPSSYHYLKGIPIMLLVLGSIILLISIFGSFGVFKKNLFLLNLYTAILLFIFILQIVLSIGTFWAVDNQSSLALKVNTTVDDIFKNYKENERVVDFLQEKLGCCGTNGSSFWTHTNSKVPLSCYEDRDSKNPKFGKGCQNSLYDFLLNTVRIVGTTILALAPLEVIGATFSLSLVNAIRNDIRRYGKYNI